MIARAHQAVAALALLAGCGGPASPTERVVVALPRPTATAAPRAPDLPPLARVFASYRVGTNDDEMKRAAQDVIDTVERGAQIDRATADALWSCFMRYQPSKTNSIVGTQRLHDAVLAVKDPSYGEKAIAALAAPAARQSDDGFRRVDDQLAFWQTTAIQVLRELHYERGAKALVAVLLTKDKLALASVAAAAIRTIPNAALPLLVAALDRSDPDLARLQAGWGNDTTWVGLILDVLGQTTLDAARDAIIAFVPRLDTDANRVAAAMSLVYFPKTAPSIAAFRTIYASLPPISAKGDTGIERAQLLGAARTFLDAPTGAWALREAASATGSTELAAKVGAIQSAIQVMGAREQRDVERAVAALDRLPMSAAEKREVVGAVRAMLKSAEAALTECQSTASCYVRLLEQPMPAGKDANWKTVKAAYMAGMLGDDATREDLVAHVPRVKDAATRLAIALAVNHLAPKGSAADAEALERIVADDRARHDSDALRGDDALARVAVMLRARK